MSNKNSHFQQNIHYYDALPDLVPFAQSKKREKYSWRNVKKEVGIAQMIPNCAKRLITWGLSFISLAL